MEIKKREDGKFEIILDRDQLQDLFDQVDKDMDHFEPSESHFSNTMIEFDIDAYTALSE